MTSDTFRSLFSNQSFKGKTPVGDDDDTSGSSKEVRPDMSPSAIIRVLGTGGGGGNAVHRMVQTKMKGVEFIAVNTDVQALYHNNAPKKITIGRGITRGLGAGSNPDLGKRAAEESTEELKAVLEGADMLFITAGLGGGTGGGSIATIAELARGMGILTVGVVTKPFNFEGEKRRTQAEEQLANLHGKVDTLITIPNDKILAMIDKTTPLTEAFELVDQVLHHSIEGITSLIMEYGLVNVDFADVKTIMQDAGTALMGIGYGTGDSRAAEAARAAVDSPLLEMDISGAKGILFNITGGNDLSMFEVDEAARIITEAADPDANVIFGAVIDEQQTGHVKCTVVATGFEHQEIKSLPTHLASHGKKQYTSSAPFASEKNNEKGLTESPVFDAGFSSTKVDLNEEELEVPAFMRKKIGK